MRRNYRLNEMERMELERERERELQDTRTPEEKEEIRRLAYALSTGDYSDVQDLFDDEMIEENYDEEYDNSDSHMSSKEKEDLKILIKALETGDYGPAMHILADEEIIEEGKDCKSCVTPSTGKRKKIAKFSEFKK